MALVQVSIQNQAGVALALQRIPGKARRAIANALNRTGRYARTEAINLIAQRVNFKKRYLQQRMELLRARSSELSFTIIARKRGTLLSRFPFKQLWKPGKTVRRRKAGIEVRVKPGRVEKLPGAFLVPLRRGKELGAGPMGIALRNPGARKAYEVLHSTSVNHAFSDVLPTITRLASAKFNAEVQASLGNELRKL